MGPTDPLEPRRPAPGATEAVPAEEDDPVEASRMTLAEHLTELRSRLIRSALTFVAAFVVLWTFRAPVVEFIRMPFDWATTWLNEDLVEIYGEKVEAGAPAERYFEPGYPDAKVVLPEKRVSKNLNFFGPGSSFFLSLRTCFWMALFVAGPVALYQLWAFIAAGLYRRERKVVYRYFPASLALFLAGVAFGFFVMVPYALYFLSKEGLGDEGTELTISADLYLQFIKSLALAVGVVFQLPVLQIALARLGVVDPALYGKYRGHMMVVTLVIAAILTPPDPVTQMLLAVPAIILYEIGAVLSRWVWTPVPSSLESARAT